MTERERTAAERRLGILRQVAGIPTAPMHEFRVARHVADQCRRIGLRPSRDRFGNLLVHLGDTSESPLVLVAHMDHPAFEVVGADGGEASAHLLGGVKPECFARPVKVEIFGESGSAPGTITGYQARAPRDVDLTIEVDAPVVVGDFGVFFFPAYQIDGDRVYLRAADDLAGCAAILATLEELIGARLSTGVIGVFTRAEEVGLVGALLLAEAGTLPRDSIVVSLECSRELPGATMGAGPVIRVGDAASTFDATAEARLQVARQTLASRQPPLAIQRQLMSGGVCEATAFAIRGYRATGVALPLGNYHNVGPNDTISPEYISAGDYLAEVDLLVAAATEPMPRGDLLGRFAESAAKLRSRLEETATSIEVE